VSRGSTSSVRPPGRSTAPPAWIFLVELDDLPTHAYADAYFRLLSDLEALFERPVDLVMASAVKNPFVRETIERSRIPLHAA
jgi:hypothetical protein